MYWYGPESNCPICIADWKQIDVQSMDTSKRFVLEKSVSGGHHLQAMPQMALKRLQELVLYNPETGKFSSKVNGPGRAIGQQAGSIKHSGDRKYIHLRVAGEWILAHRLAWFYMFGHWPPNDIDHVNGDGTDNRLANLRLATEGQNCMNRRVHCNNTSGFKGVTFDKESGRWRSQIQIDGKHQTLGRFQSPRHAALAYNAAARRFFGSFAKVNSFPIVRRAE